jgi:hypothetical protein
MGVRNHADTVSPKQLHDQSAVFVGVRAQLILSDARATAAVRLGHEARRGQARAQYTSSAIASSNACFATRHARSGLAMIS